MSHKPPFEQMLDEMNPSPEVSAAMTAIANDVVLPADRGLPPDPEGQNDDRAALAQREADDRVRNAATAIKRDVCELDYSAGPDEEAMLAVSVNDLRRICIRHIAALVQSEAPQPYEQRARQAGDWPAFSGDVLAPHMKAEIDEWRRRYASPVAAPEAPACSHVWNDFGQLGGRNVSWCPRCDTLAWTGKEPEPATQQAAPEAPASEQQTTVAMECVKAVSIGYTDTSHMTEELHCAECKANLDGGDDHKADCLTLRARAFLATPAATTASASMPVCNPIWYADEGNFGERVVRCRSCGTYKGTPCGITPAQQTERMQPSREADFDVDAILAAICEEAGYINLSMQSIREILAKHGAALARAPLPDPVYAEPASLRAEAPASEQRVKEVEQMSHLECYAELQDKWISEDDCNSVDFEAKYGRYTIEKIRSELQKHRAAATASPRCTCPSGDGSLRWPCPKHSTGEKQNG